MLFLRSFQRETNRLCGYADLYKYSNVDRFIPFSSMKTRVSETKNGVNLA